MTPLTSKADATLTTTRLVLAGIGSLTACCARDAIVSAHCDAQCVGNLLDVDAERRGPLAIDMGE